MIAQVVFSSQGNSSWAAHVAGVVAADAGVGTDGFGAAGSIFGIPGDYEKWQQSAPPYDYGLQASTAAQAPAAPWHYDARSGFIGVVMVLVFGAMLVRGWRRG